MLSCAECAVKNCAIQNGRETEEVKNCPSADSVVTDCREIYFNDKELLIAQKSAVCAPDHGEDRISKTIRFAKECGYKKLGLAFCISLANEAREVDRRLKEAGFEVESIICKVGHESRELIGMECAKRSMCNPIAQAKLLNSANTELNILLGLCVGHDTLFFMHSKAPVTVLATKDHVYHHAPLQALKNTENRGIIDD